jgi:hypothetical protein
MVWFEWGREWFWSSLCAAIWSIEPFMDHTLKLIQHNWVVLAYNFNVEILVLIIIESSIGAFLLTILLQFYPCYYIALSFYSCTCWVPTKSVLNLAIFPCYSSLLLRRRRWTRILRRGVLGYVLPRLSFLWSYRVFRYSVSLRVIIVFRDITYVIIILYSWHMVIYEHFWPYVWNNWSCVMHMMSTWFWHKKPGMTISRWEGAMVRGKRAYGIDLIAWGGRRSVWERGRNGSNMKEWFMV